MELSNKPLGLPEIWSGIECTINRVEDVFHDQLEYSGHYRRGTADLEQLAALGIKALRYPVLWERHEPLAGAIPDFTFAAEGLDFLREKGIEPILGLVHHGSGPAWASFMDGSFEAGLQAYARRVAEAFPWVTRYTPVNEPLTTARFCGLYGHWYPHGASDSCFIRVLLAECRATILAMEAIRSVNPAACLFQTEDLGKTYSTPLLRYQARLENRRRWLSIDLIAGRVNQKHPLWQYLLDAGATEEELGFFRDRGRMPEVIGLNYYVTSERYIDEALEHYPPAFHGGNGIHEYADVEAVRVPLAEPTGVEPLVRDAWNRYRQPLAMTEVHLGGSREQQLRWLYRIWERCCRLRSEGVDLRGLTAWGAFGMYGWNQLCRTPGGEYEPGLFDVRSGTPRPTALAGLVRSLAGGGSAAHPVLMEPGWWETGSRWLYRVSEHAPIDQPEPAAGRPVLILGQTGTLGQAFARVCAARGIRFQIWDRTRLDILRPDDALEAIAAVEPWAVINATGYVRVNDAESEPELCHRINCDGAVNIARVCDALGIRYLGFSSDLVFDGRKGAPYLETDATCPVNAYGRSKAAAEPEILRVCPQALVVRTSSFFGPWDDFNFLHFVLGELREGRTVATASDVMVSPTYVPDLADECLTLLLDDVSGIRHITNGGALSWTELARRAAALAGLDTALIREERQVTLGWAAPHPAYSALGSAYGAVLPSLDDALLRFMEARSAAYQPSEAVLRHSLQGD